MDKLYEFEIVGVEDGRFTSKIIQATVPSETTLYTAGLLIQGNLDRQGKHNMTVVQSSGRELINMSFTK